MKNVQDCFVLNNGVKIPCIGFGTWQTPNDDTGIQAVIAALEAGYRHIDTAAGYYNEESVGIAVRKSGIKREDLFITSKLWNTDHGYEAAKAAFEKTMGNLKMDYIDLFLIHWPNPVHLRDSWAEANAGTWKAFEEFYTEGRIKALGISNFLPHHMDALLKTANIVPAVNQIRLSPGITQDETCEYCKKRGILLEAYSPLGTGGVFKSKEMQDLASKYNKTIAQICVKWCLQKDYLPLPKSVKKERIIENIDVFDFEISQADIDYISKINIENVPNWDPDTVSW